MMKVRYRVYLGLSAILLLTLLSTPERASAQWPPFGFVLTPSHENGKITYKIEFSSWVNWAMTDVTFKIAPPAGTRFVQANASPATSVSFDGAEITFFTDHVPPYGSVSDANFIVEVTDTSQVVFMTHAWISWKGDQPGDYLTKDVPIDLTKQTLNWTLQSYPDLQFETRAAVTGEVITYTIYVRKEAWRRMQDLKINVPLPEGTTFLSAQAPPPFSAKFDGREVSFFILEIEKKITLGPLTFKVSTQGVTAPLLATHAWATWKNSDIQVGKSIPSQEELRTGDIIVQPHVSQQVEADLIGDVPFSNYDLTSIALLEDASDLRVVFYTVGELKPGEPLAFALQIDGDCNGNTGDQGWEYRIRYTHDQGRADFLAWKQEKDWTWVSRLDSSASGNMATIRLPYNLFEPGRQFCWSGEALNLTKSFNSPLPVDGILNWWSPELTLVTRAPAEPEQETGANTAVAEPLAGTFISMGDTWQYLPGWSEPPADWKMINFDDKPWFSGPTRIGYGRQNNATDLSQITRPVQTGSTPTLVQQVITPTGMILAVLPSGESESVFLRRSFTVATLAGLTHLTLNIDYEAGFVAYLNGTEVARRGLGAPNSPVAYNTLADPHKAGVPEAIDLTDDIPRLITGTNVLAVQAHKSPDQTLLSVGPELAWSNNPAETAPAPEPAAASAPAVASASPPSPGPISGKLAVPLNNDQGVYNVHIFSMPDGREITTISNARQPNFRFDGRRLLLNREGGGTENLHEYNLSDTTQQPVSDAPRDSHPFYDLYGNRVVYDNPELIYGKTKPASKEYLTPFIFVQCGLLPPHLEQEPRCRDIPTLGVLVPAGQTGEIQGTHPLWTATDMIAYKGCNSWAGFAACGIYLVSSASTKGFSDGFIPRQLTRNMNDIPSDTKGNFIAFTSDRDGNWEAYLMDLNGAGVKNLSDSSISNDGLPTISPQGDWVAFVSDRGGRWAVWTVPLTGGVAQKLFDLPDQTPWGSGDLAWTNERISWGP